MPANTVIATQWIPRMEEVTPSAPLNAILTFFGVDNAYEALGLQLWSDRPLTFVIPVELPAAASCAGAA